MRTVAARAAKFTKQILITRNVKYGLYDLDDPYWIKCLTHQKMSSVRYVIVFSLFKKIV